MKIDLKIEGEKEIQIGFKTVLKKLENLKDPIGDSIEFMIREVEKQHSSSGSEFGKRWTPLSRKYTAKKRKRWGSQPILTASGKMRKSYSSRISENSGVIFNTASYFPKHQLGTKDIPQRRVLFFDEKRVQGVVKIFSKYIHKQAIQEGWLSKKT